MEAASDGGEHLFLHVGEKSSGAVSVLVFVFTGLAEIPVCTFYLLDHPPGHRGSARRSDFHPLLHPLLPAGLAACQTVLQIVAA